MKLFLQFLVCLIIGCFVGLGLILGIMAVRLVYIYIH